MKPLPPTPTLLVVDDDPVCRGQLVRLGEGVGTRVEAVAEPGAALARVERGGIDVVITDLCMPDMSGTELIKKIQTYDRYIPCILMTGFGTADKAADALRAGAFWYLPKPFDGGSRSIRRLIDRALEHGRLQSLKKVEESAPQPEMAPTMVGVSAALKNLLTQAAQVATTNATVLIQGESGSGKDLVARTIHARSHRASKPFVAMNCGAIPEELLESELFGHTKGSFTSATANREGRFVRADGGTIFLDEVGDMSSRFQVKLLRVLETGDFQPVGSSKSRHADVRVIAATNQDLQNAVARGTFREDLFYRLNVVPLVVPSLRERAADIPLLIAHFLAKIARTSKSREKQISPDAIDALCCYDWPGNIRELENMIERLMVLSEGETIELEALPPSLAKITPRTGSSPPAELTFREAVERFKTTLLIQALDDSHWNKSAAALALGMKRTTLVDMIRRKRLQDGPATRRGGA